MPRILVLLGLLASLSACGGLNRAVTVLPDTLDDLGRQTEPLRAGRQPGDEALAARP